MKKILTFVIAIVFLFVAGVSSVQAATRVRGYYRSNGTYVNSYYRSNRNSYKIDNYSTRGNYNPYTGKKGYKSWY